MGRMDSEFAWQEEYSVLVGMDWADRKHDFCLRGGGDMRTEHGELEQTPEAVDTWVMSLRERFGDKPIAIALEQSKGALTNALLKYDFIVLFPVDGKKLKAYRSSYVSSGASNDKGDAKLLWEYLHMRGLNMRPIRPDTPDARLLAQFTQRRRDTVDERTRLTNQLQATLKLYFPQALALVGEDLYAPMSLNLLKRWPTLESIKRPRKETLRSFYTKHGCRSEEKIAERLQLIDHAVPLTNDPAILEDSVMLVEHLVKMLDVLNEAIEKYEARIVELMKTHEDAPIYASLPGAGDAMEPRLAAAMGTNRDRWQSALEILTLHGIAPVTQQSGKGKCFVHWRWACHKFTRQTWHEFAEHSRRHCVWANAFYLMKRQQGKGHHAALRALAFKWIRIVHRCWRERCPYNEGKYLKSLRKHGATLIQFMKDNDMMPVDLIASKV